MQKSIIASIGKVVLILALITLFDMFAAIYLIVMDRSLIPVKTLLITMGITLLLLGGAAILVYMTRRDAQREAENLLESSETMLKLKLWVVNSARHAIVTMAFSVAFSFYWMYTVDDMPFVAIVVMAFLFFLNVCLAFIGFKVGMSK